MKPTSPPGTWSATWWVARKELVTSFRDRQTAIYAIVLPICLYPVMFWIMIQGFLLIQGRREHTSVHVGVASPSSAEIPARLLLALNDPDGASSESSDASEREATSPPLQRVETWVLHDSTDPERAYNDSKAGDSKARNSMDGADSVPDAVLFLGAPGDKPAVIAFDSTDTRSTIAEERVRKRLEAFAESEREAAAVAIGLDPRELDPIGTDERNLAPDEEMGAYVLSLVFPLLLVLMTVLGAFYPAVDLTAGERERGTAETTLLLPIPRLAVHQGKILAVCISAVLATSLNLLALGLSAGHLLKMIAAGASIEIELPLSSFVAIAPLALLFAFCVSALLTGIAALAKSFKEGQALLGPVQMIFIFPAMTSVLPGLELDWGTALIPIVNVVMAFRSILRAEVLPFEYTLTALSLLFYAWLAITFAVRILSREALSFSNETISLRRLFSFLKSESSSS